MTKEPLHPDNASGKIPKLIIQFWHDKNILPDPYREAMQTTKNHNADFNQLYVDDDFMHHLLKNKFSSRLCELYRLNKIPSSRSDIARFALLYEFGGIYLDASMQVYKSLNPLLEGNAKILLLQRDDQPRYKDYPEKAHVVNGIVAAVPKSPFILACIQKIINNLSSGEFNHSVMPATGLIINEALEEYEDKNSIQKLSFTRLKQERLDHLRIKGLFNSWKPLEKHGIIDADKLEALNGSMLR